MGYTSIGFQCHCLIVGLKWYFYASSLDLSDQLIDNWTNVRCVHYRVWLIWLWALFHRLTNQLFGWFDWSFILHCIVIFKFDGERVIWAIKIECFGLFDWGDHWSNDETKLATGMSDWQRASSAKPMTTKPVAMLADLVNRQTTVDDRRHQHWHEWCLRLKNNISTMISRKIRTIKRTRVLLFYL